MKDFPFKPADAVARHVDDGELPTLDEAHTIPDEDLIECMVKVRGIGPLVRAGPASRVAG